MSQGKRPSAEHRCAGIVISLRKIHDCTWPLSVKAAVPLMAFDAGLVERGCASDA